MVLAIHSFYVIAWESGMHFYSRTWVKMGKDPVLLSGLMASLEMMAKSITSQYVNIITLEDSRFFFRVDEKHKVLFVLITDISQEESRFKEYLDILSTRFLQIFHTHLDSLQPLEGSHPTQAYDELVDSLVSGWAQGESSLDKAKAMDVLEVFSLFFNVYLQKFLTKEMREQHWGSIQTIFQENIPGTPQHRLSISQESGVNYSIGDLHSINYALMLDALSRTFVQLLSFVQQVITKRSYEALYFAYVIPLLRSERTRLIAYNLFEPLVMLLL
jgi:hypothetical protein